MAWRTAAGLCAGRLSIMTMSPGIEIRLAHARGSGAGVATALHLSEDYKTEIRKLLGRVAKVVNQADIPDDKKDRNSTRPPPCNARWTGPGPRWPRSCRGCWM